MKRFEDRLVELTKRKAESNRRKKHGIKTAGDLWYETDKFLSENKNRKLLTPEQTDKYFSEFEGDDYIPVDKIATAIEKSFDFKVISSGEDEVFLRQFVKIIKNDLLKELGINTKVKSKSKENETEKKLI